MNPITSLFFTVFLLAGAASAAAQADCRAILNKANAAYAKGNLDKALEYLHDTEECDYRNTLKVAVQSLESKVFAAIQEQKRQAEKARKYAEEAQQIAETALEQAELGKKIAQEQQQISEARRWDVLATSFLTQKMHSKALALIMLRVLNYGDTLTTPAEQLVGQVFSEKEPILLRRFNWQLPDTVENPVQQISIGPDVLMTVCRQNGVVELWGNWGLKIQDITHPTEKWKGSVFSPRYNILAVYSDNLVVVYRAARESNKIVLHQTAQYTDSAIQFAVISDQDELFIVTANRFYSASRPAEMTYTYSGGVITSLQPYHCADVLDITSCESAFLCKYQPDGDHADLETHVVVIVPPKKKKPAKIRTSNFKSDEIYMAPSKRFFIKKMQGKIAYVNYKGNIMAYFNTPPANIAITPYDKEGMKIITYGPDHLSLWDGKGNTVTRFLEPGEVKGVVFLHDNKHLFSFSSTTGNLWSLTQEKVLSQTGAHPGINNIESAHLTAFGKSHSITLIHKGYNFSVWEICTPPENIAAWMKDRNGLPITNEEIKAYELKRY